MIPTRQINEKDLDSEYDGRKLTAGTASMPVMENWNTTVHGMTVIMPMSMVSRIARGTSDLNQGTQLTHFVRSCKALYRLRVGFSVSRLSFAIR